MLYQVNTEKNTWIYETRNQEFNRIEVEFEADQPDDDDITIYSICLVKADDPKVNEGGIPYQSGAVYRVQVFRFVNEATISRLSHEIKAMLRRKTWEEVFSKPLPA